MRTPPDVSLYHRHGNPLFAGVLERLGRDESVHAVVLPRTAEQREAIRGLGLPSLHVPEHAVDAQSLVALADLVVSAGGTMNREAAALGHARLHDVQRAARRGRRDADRRGTAATARRSQASSSVRKRRRPATQLAFAAIRGTLLDVLPFDSLGHKNRDGNTATRKRGDFCMRKALGASSCSQPDSRRPLRRPQRHNGNSGLQDNTGPDDRPGRGQACRYTPIISVGDRLAGRLHVRVDPRRDLDRLEQASQARHDHKGDKRKGDRRKGDKRNGDKNRGGKHKSHGSVEIYVNHETSTVPFPYNGTTGVGFNDFTNALVSKLRAERDSPAAC